MCLSACRPHAGLKMRERARLQTVVPRLDASMAHICATREQSRRFNSSRSTGTTASARRRSNEAMHKVRGSVLGLRRAPPALDGTSW
jgi:hypothetical protein